MRLHSSPPQRNGFSVADFSLGLCYETGQGVRQDLDQAVRWYRVAVHHGDPAATANLALLYEEGRGVASDPHEAFRLFNLAAERGNPKAFNNLANAYYYGQGVEADPLIAYMWVEIAGTSGESVSAARQKVAARLSQSEIDEAIRRARLWRAFHAGVLGSQRSQFLPAKTAP